MSEKEFILAMFEIVWPDAAVPELIDEVKERIDKFLEYHHQHYFEVEFVKKDSKEIWCNSCKTHHE